MPPIFGIVPTSPSVINSDLQQEMDRRSKTRVDVQLTLPFVTADQVRGYTPVRVLTENLSRTRNFDALVRRFTPSGSLQNHDFGRPASRKTLISDPKLCDAARHGIGSYYYSSRGRVSSRRLRCSGEHAASLSPATFKPRSRNVQDLATMPLASSRISLTHAPTHRVVKPITRCRRFRLTACGGWRAVWHSRYRLSRACFPL